MIHLSWTFVRVYERGIRDGQVDSMEDCQGSFAGHNRRLILYAQLGN